jgi:putative ABC transport system permease protein
VLAYSVAQRTSEFGIRVALGARGSDILKLVFSQGMRLVAIGLAAGLAASFALTRLLTKLLFEVSAADPLSFAGISLLLTLTACLMPALRATKVDPLTALHHQ